MKKNGPEDVQTEVEKKVMRRTKKKRPNMKVSGRSVKNLQRLIVQKSRFDKEG